MEFKHDIVLVSRSEFESSLAFCLLFLNYFTTFVTVILLKYSESYFSWLPVHSDEDKEAV